MRGGFGVQHAKSLASDLSTVVPKLEDPFSGYDLPGVVKHELAIRLGADRTANGILAFVVPNPRSRIEQSRLRKDGDEPELHARAGGSALDDVPQAESQRLARRDRGRAPHQRGVPDVCDRAKAAMSDRQVSAAGMKNSPLEYPNPLDPKFIRQPCRNREDCEQNRACAQDARQDRCELVRTLAHVPCASVNRPSEGA